MSDESKTPPTTSEDLSTVAAAPVAPSAAHVSKADAAAASGADAPADFSPQQLKAMIAALQGELEQVQGRVEAKEAQLDAANDKVLRSYADLDNMRKRVEREKEETAKYAIAKFARDVVGVADNFERAVASVPADAKVDNPALVALIEGVTLTEREFLNVLERHGVKRVSPQGEAFNPNFHQAVMETHNPDVPAGTVLQVFQQGYMIDDRVLRSAMVVVSSGGAKAGKTGDKSKPDHGSGNGEAA